MKILYIIEHTESLKQTRTTIGGACWRGGQTVTVCDNVTCGCDWHSVRIGILHISLDGRWPAWQMSADSLNSVDNTERSQYGPVIVCS